jgi:hypothetical protein
MPPPAMITGISCAAWLVSYAWEEAAGALRGRARLNCGLALAGAAQALECGSRPLFSASALVCRK